MSALANLKRTFATIASRRDNAVEEFKNKLDKDPVNAFEWADSTMQAVAKGRIADTYLHHLGEWEKARDAGTLDPAQPQTEELVIDWINRSIHRQAILQGSYVKRSTSVCSNFMAAEAAAGYADLANDWAFVS